MNHHDDHAELVNGFYDEQKELFDASSQGMYVFLDDDNRICNATFAKLLGYASAEAWAKVDVDGSFPDAFVADKSQHALISAYQNAMEKGAGSTFQVTWKKKSGETVNTTVTLVPIIYQGHMLALHFVS
jgi:hypothetical protein